MADSSKRLSPEQLREERTLRTLQTLVDCAGRRIISERMPREQAEALSADVRLAAARIIPDQMELYDLVYGSRFRRWIETHCPAQDGSL